VQRSECRLCRHAAVAYRSLVGEMWERGAVCSLLLQFVQTLQLVSMISRELARWVWWCLQLLLPPLLLPDSSLGGFTGPVGLSASCRFGIFNDSCKSSKGLRWPRLQVTSRSLSQSARARIGDG
jgi:hypothetical protein